MSALARYIEGHVDEALTLDRLAERSGYSPSHLQRVFKSVFGVSPKTYQASLRLEVFKGELRRGAPVVRATYEAGYGSSSRAHEAATRSLGMTPSSYRKGGEDESISYASRPTRFGELLIAATDRGVCFATFLDDGAEAPGPLVAEFPHAQVSPAPASGEHELDRWIEALQAHLDRGAPRPELPLDLRGTAFQMTVWRFLLTIPHGQVRTYTEVARGIGRPAAVRPVANACARNRVALLVPCHRVLRGDGDLGGYRFGGPPRKRALLDAERDARTDA